MKLMKGIKVALGAAILVASFGAQASTMQVQNEWVCKMHDEKSPPMMFWGAGVDRNTAASQVMSACSAGSVDARNCHLDYCTPPQQQ